MYAGWGSFVKGTALPLLRIGNYMTYKASDLKPKMVLGYFTLLTKVKRKKKGSHWRVRCECCKVLTVPQSYLLRKKTPKTHCGCKNKTVKTLFNQEYRIWLMMKKRCYDPDHVAFKHYGGRGIIMCDEFLHPETGFEAFLKAIRPRPSKKYSVDRIKVEGNYEPGNIRWATAKEQAANKRK